MNYFDLMQEHPKLFNNSNAPLRIITDQIQIENWQARQITSQNEKEWTADWGRIGILTNDPYTLIIRDLVEFPNGSKRGYLRSINRADLLGGRGVAVLPLLDSQIILLRNFRHATRSWHLEIPRGFGEPKISAPANARKEIKEEIGAQVKRLEDLGEFHINTGVDATVVNLFIAFINQVGEPNLDEGIAEIVKVSVLELENLIAIGQVTDSFTISAWARARLLNKLPIGK